jgi:hypothetical protein
MDPHDGHARAATAPFCRCWRCRNARAHDCAGEFRLSRARLPSPIWKIRVTKLASYDCTEMQPPQLRTRTWTVATPRRCEGASLLID